MKEETMNGSIGLGATLNFKTPIGNIQLEDLIYEPNEDITTFELAKLLHLFTCLRLDGRNYFDTRGFIKKNNLLRHFREV
jgi:hypothetical protein